MSDVINKPVASTSNATAGGTNANSEWKLLLVLFVLISVACLIWLLNSLSSVSQYFLDFTQSVVLPVVVFVIGVLGIVFALYQLLKQRGGSERLLIEKETLRRRQEAEAESERARQIQEENERNQVAILRLLDELGDLAEGDLTVNATVSEDFTGAIADSVNFAIDQLRQLVLVINNTADRVSQSSEQTQMNAVELAEASEHQAQEIAGVSAAINEMTISIDQVSNNASESATVASAQLLLPITEQKLYSVLLKV